MTARQSFLAGVKAALPFLVGLWPFGFVVGAAAVDAGFGVTGAMSFSVFYFAGASQLAAIELLSNGSGPIIVAITVLTINLRFMLYSAALSPWFADIPLAQRLALATPLVDQNFALSVQQYRDNPDTHRIAYYLGVTAALFGNWQLTTALGAVAGTFIPDDVPLSMAIPMMFLVMAMGSIRDRPTLAAALTSTVLATALQPLPNNAGFMIAVLTGIATGATLSRRNTNKDTVPVDDPASTQGGEA